jgi:ribonuclease R
MRFEMLSEPKPLAGSTRSYHKAKGRIRALKNRPGTRGRRR